MGAVVVVGRDSILLRLKIVRCLLLAFVEIVEGDLLDPERTSIEPADEEAPPPLEEREVPLMLEADELRLEGGDEIIRELLRCCSFGIALGHYIERTVAVVA